LRTPTSDSLVGGAPVAPQTRSCCTRIDGRARSKRSHGSFKATPKHAVTSNWALCLNWRDAMHTLSKIMLPVTTLLPFSLFSLDSGHALAVQSSIPNGVAANRHPNRGQSDTFDPPSRNQGGAGARAHRTTRNKYAVTVN